MSSRDELQLIARLRIKTLIAQVYSRVSAAEMLIAPKAGKYPHTAEAHAHAMLFDARSRMDAWLMEAGAAVGLDVQAIEKEGANGQATQDAKEAPAAGSRSDLRAGGEAQAGQAAQPLPG